MSTKSTSESAKHTVVKGNDLFAKNMYQELATNDGNVFFSPISIHALLSLAFQGAGGETRDTFAKVLNIPDETSAAKGYYEIMKKLNSLENVTLLMANKIYLMNKYEPQDDFKTTTTEKFLSEVQKVNFAENDKTARVINNWVEEKTQNKIRDLIKSDSLSADTNLVLVNAIYFISDWAHPFDRRNTLKEYFYISENDYVEIDMMFQFDSFNYKEDEDLEAEVLELPYSNENFSLVIILPKERTGIRDLEKKLQNVNLTKITENMIFDDVGIYLPKFKIEATIELNEVLKKMGLDIIFDESKADFSKLIIGGERLVVSEVVQKTYIDVNEEGTEAAAAAGCKIMCFSTTVTQFMADHPFSFYLVYKTNENNTIPLFQGRFSNP